MALSKDLVSAFVKVTNDTKKVEEPTLYGTVVEYDDLFYVKLDDTDRLTPMRSVADAKPGDRVTVSIKNHAATITGNLSSPAARVDDVKNLNSEVVLQGSKITAIDTELVSIGDSIKSQGNEIVAVGNTIEAVQNDITILDSTVKTQGSTIETIDSTVKTHDSKIGIYDSSFQIQNGVVTGIKGVDTDWIKTSDLEADSATIKDLVAENAEIKGSLKATSADIGNLKADVADIDTLIFGSATGDTIHTNFANAVIAQLGEAQIKSAMIQNVSADKIAAGDISTNNVRVVSDDGKLLISDETIQISDDSRVRVQIGKDASNDYSINIWDADGNLMFSQGGITDSAIKEAIIRNDMVSENANISASKLDISSLFKEINDSTETIKSSKIYLNDEEQTLDVAFTSMSSDLEDLSGIVSSQGTQLSVVQGKIESKVWQQDIDKASGEMGTQYTSLKQTVNGISSTVTSHTSKINDLETDVTNAQTAINQNKNDISLRATKTEVVEAIDNIEIGGRNLIVYKDMSVYQGTLDYDSVSGLVSVAGIKWYIDLLKPGSFENNTTYTLSIGDVINDHSVYTNKVTTGIYDTATQTYKIQQKHLYSNDVYTFTIGDADEWNTETLHFYLYFNMNDVASNGSVSSLKLEKGNKATDWTASPEDIESNITENHYTKTQTDAQIKVSSDAITSTVNANYEMLDVSGRNLIVRKGELIDTYVQASGEVLECGVNYKSATMADHIRIQPGEIYTFSKDASTINYYFRWAWYDKDMKVLGRDAQSVTINRWTAPSNAAYIRVSYPYLEGANPKLERGSEATEYCPAIEDVGDVIDNVDAKFDNYSTTSEMNSAINQKADSITSSVNAKFNNYSTTSEMNSAINQKADSITSTVSATYTTKTEFKNLYVGGRNLIKNSDFSNDTTGWVVSGLTTSVETDSTHGTCLKITSSAVGSSTHRIYPDTGTNFIHKGGWYALSFYARADSACTLQSNAAGSDMPARNKTLGTTWQRYTEIYEASGGSITFWLTEAGKTAYITKVKMENGNKVTDWTPAPEDIDQDISDVESAANESIDGVKEELNSAKSTIQQLSDSILTLVSDENGGTYLQQTSTGWTFSTTDIQEKVSGVSENLNKLTEDVGSVSGTVNALQTAVDELSDIKERVTIGTYTYVDDSGVSQTEPSIDLCESDTGFTLKITNTKVIFMDSSVELVSIDSKTRSIKLERAEIKGELVIGGFEWEKRANGNIGLVWKG